MRKNTHTTFLFVLWLCMCVCARADSPVWSVSVLHPCYGMYVGLDDICSCCILFGMLRPYIMLIMCSASYYIYLYSPLQISLNASLDASRDSVQSTIY